MCKGPAATECPDPLITDVRNLQYSLISLKTDKGVLYLSMETLFNP